MINKSYIFTQFIKENKLPKKESFEGHFPLCCYKLFLYSRCDFAIKTITKTWKDQAAVTQTNWNENVWLVVEIVGSFKLPFESLDKDERETRQKSSLKTCYIEARPSTRCWIRLKLYNEKHKTDVFGNKCTRKCPHGLSSVKHKYLDEKTEPVTYCRPRLYLKLPLYELWQNPHSI